ncbi:MAG: aspartate--tRNA ligase [Nanoarchaeota archaeon]|nr:aspartate--tRNA ligase [Nanoarchaeota archaeon]
MYRTHTCGELTKKEVGKKVTLAGWVDSVRSHGKVNFIDLRDRYGKTQVVILGKLDVKPEYCIQVEGEVVARKEGMTNKDMATGDIEVFTKKLNVLNECPTLPFELNDESVSEDLKLKDRYIDLRSDRLQKKLFLRHKLYAAIMEYMDKEGFVYIETPILAKSTPEGARDYIVPSRVNAGTFYALPQSPQIFKQLCMVAGFDKYYQIARCFRDEDLRADRQPEFTQLDIEMSFVEVDDIINTMEGLYKHIWKKVLNVDLKTPFPRISYKEAMEKYNRDNPDLRKNPEDKNEWAFCWVVDFPSFEYNEEDKRWYAVHHPFTSPEDGVDFSKPGEIKAKAYDLVLNGSEIGGGSIRIHNREIQNKVFETLGLSEEEANEKFGFLLNALSRGAPPHGGIAFGLDRVAQLLTQSDNIREVIAFPKNKAAQDVMMDAPSAVSEAQLRDAHIKLDVKVAKKDKK